MKGYNNNVANNDDLNTNKINFTQFQERKQKINERFSSKNLKDVTEKNQMNQYDVLIMIQE